MMTGRPLPSSSSCHYFFLLRQGQAVILLSRREPSTTPVGRGKIKGGWLGVRHPITMLHNREWGLEAKEQWCMHVHVLFHVG